MKQKAWIYPLSGLAVFIAVSVVVLGAYTRLTNSGLGCPDWPGCYGHLLPGHGAAELGKAWTEMVHRYLAGTLGALTIGLALVCLWYRRRLQLSVLLPLCLIAVVGMQATLGMWTVTMKLLPIVVMGHLLGGLTVLSLLWILRMSIRGTNFINSGTRHLRPWVVWGLIIVIAQIALGGWTSTNYAGIACLGFPQCNGQWVPELHLGQAFEWMPIGANYQGGMLDMSARITIQWLHRFGAVITLLYGGVLAIMVYRGSRDVTGRSLAIALVLALVLQFILGIINVLYLLPLPVAVLHNLGAALVLLIMVSMAYHVFARRGEIYG